MDATRRDTSYPGDGPAPASVARARREYGRTGDPDRLEEYIGFRAGDETFALPLALVREILKPPPITEVPRARPEVLGIVSVRGQITTVVDLRRRLHLPPQSPSVRTRILLVEGGAEVLGLLVDEVTQVYRLSDQEIEPAAVVGGDLGAHVAGVGRPRIRGLRGEAQRASDELLVLLDLGALLTIF